MTSTTFTEDQYRKRGIVLAIRKSLLLNKVLKRNKIANLPPGLNLSKIKHEINKVQVSVAKKHHTSSIHAPRLP